MILCHWDRKQRPGLERQDTCLLGCCVLYYNYEQLWTPSSVRLELTESSVLDGHLFCDMIVILCVRESEGLAS